MSYWPGAIRLSVLFNCVNVCKLINLCEVAHPFVRITA